MSQYYDIQEMKDSIKSIHPEASTEEINTIINKALKDHPLPPTKLTEGTCNTETCKSRRSDGYKAAAAVRDTAITAGSLLPFPQNAVAIAAAWAAYGVACAIIDNTIND